MLRTCEICGQEFKPNLGATHEQWKAAVIALKECGLEPASAKGDEEFYDEIEAGKIDPNNVCITCCTDDNGKLKS